jgi:phosphopantothenoylcysteine decarboxylase / phosphopantothenate---cysteine ligase
MAGQHRIVLGVTGSIAAFKAAALASDMTKAGFEVRTVLTDGGAKFVSPLTFEALTGFPAETSLWDERPGSSRMGHLDLARWAERLVVAPATASTLARLALGLADDLLGAVAVATHAPLIIAPAMESAMFTHPTTRSHLAILRGRGAAIVGPTTGRLASGAEGTGRMVEPDEILHAVIGSFDRDGDLAGWSVLITAGPTHEPIDPVRFIGNRSSGKMGYAIAEEARHRGADVLLITGPVSLPPPPGVNVLHVETAGEMRSAVLQNVGGRDVVVMAAAVADFRPESASEHKVKRNEARSLSLVPTDDIAAEASAAAPNAIHVGFALETGNLELAARAKLAAKNLDLVVANSVSGDHNPFGSDTNRVLFISSNKTRELPQMPKAEVARLLWDEVIAIIKSRS